MPVPVARVRTGDTEPVLEPQELQRSVDRAHQVVTDALEQDVVLPQRVVGVEHEGLADGHESTFHSRAVVRRARRSGPAPSGQSMPKPQAGVLAAMTGMPAASA